MHHRVSLLSIGIGVVIALFESDYTVAQSRTRWGVQAGGGIGWVRLQGQAPYATSARPTWQAGLLAETHLSPHWSLQYGLGGALKGFRLQEAYSYDATDELGRPVPGYYQSQDAYRLTYLQAHALLVYRPSAADNGWQLLLGGYAGMGVRGRYRYRYTDTWGNLTRNAAGRHRLVYGYTPGSGGGFGILGSSPSADIRPFDTGLQVGSGYSWRNLQVQAVYQIGLLPLLPNYLARQLEHQAYLQGTSVTLSYFLR
ncbi:outer membrane beta-barrel protein [Hymenobacter sp. 102]|uniref:outer membrane beta-barrel protein n=1 Tax=Hymenobacter sp. 102 TaxID=3403152 RepID=UPI003CF1FC38